MLRRKGDVMDALADIFGSLMRAETRHIDNQEVILFKI